MRYSAIFMPFFALLAGISGYYLRLLELRKVFDEFTGLPLRGSLITTTLIILTVGFMVIVLFYSLFIRSKKVSPQGFPNAFGTEVLAYPLVFSAVGLVWIGATAAYFLKVRSQGTIPTTDLIFLFLSAISALSVILFSVEVYQDPRKNTKLALSVIPAIFLCYWLIMLYKQNASNPVLLSYCYQCLAVMSSTMGFYYTAGFVYNKPSPGKSIFAFFAAIYFCFVTLADNHIPGIKLIFIAIIAINVFYSSLLLRNLKRKDRG